MDGEKGAGRAKERILEAALLEFSEKGVRASTTRSIAARARVNEVTLFRAFGKKERIMDALVMERLRMNAALQQMDFSRDAPLTDLLVENTLKVLDALGSDPMVSVLLREMWDQPGLRQRIADEMLAKPVDIVAGHFAHLMARGVMRRDDPLKMAWAWVAMAQSCFIARRVLGAWSPSVRAEEEHLRMLAEVFAQGAGR
jgi:TetR/AcrR family transcriptional regulator of autoinduction and epiphytic fitness